MSEIQRYDSIASIFDEISNYKKDLIFCIDENISEIYNKELKTLKAKNNKFFIFNAGERAKTFEQWSQAVEYFLEIGVNRQSHLVAIGGGALSDVAGFVASTLLRGISWSVVPTTILSQVDASIGGKVAINSRNGKNLIGNFHQPNKVFLTQEFNKTLPGEYLKSGLGEIVKYAFIDRAIAKKITDNVDMTEIMYDCANIKKNIVEKDPEEKNIRKILNLGHTFGHAIEWKFKIPHGVAVVWGMVIVFSIFKQDENLTKLKKIVKSLGLKIERLFIEDIPIEEFMCLVSKDKKIVAGNKLEMIVLNVDAEVVIEEMLVSEIERNLIEVEGDIRAFSFD